MASQEVLFCMTLIVIHCNDFYSYIGGNFQSSYSVISFDDISTFPCHDRGYFNVVVVLQSCSDSLHILPGSSIDTNATSGSVCNFSNIECDEDLDVIEEIFISINEDVDRGMKREEIPGDVTFPGIKSDPDTVSYICICLILDTFYECPGISVLF